MWVKTLEQILINATSFYLWNQYLNLFIYVFLSQRDLSILNGSRFNPRILCLFLEILISLSAKSSLWENFTMIVTTDWFQIFQVKKIPIQFKSWLITFTYITNYMKKNIVLLSKWKNKWATHWISIFNKKNIFPLEIDFST